MNSLSFIKRVVYSLKMRYGYPIEIYKIDSSITNDETGVKTVAKTKHDVRRAILLPKKLYRDMSPFVQNTPFNYGGNFDKDMRLIIVDVKDFPTSFDIALANFIVYDRIKYNVKEIQFFDSRLAAVITVEAVKGELPNQLIERSLVQTVGVSSEVNHE